MEKREQITGCSVFMPLPDQAATGLDLIELRHLLLRVHFLPGLLSASLLISSVQYLSSRQSFNEKDSKMMNFALAFWVKKQPLHLLFGKGTLLCLCCSPQSDRKDSLQPQGLVMQTFCNTRFGPQPGLLFELSATDFSQQHMAPFLVLHLLLLVFLLLHFPTGSVSQLCFQQYLQT